MTNNRPLMCMRRKPVVTAPVSTAAPLARSSRKRWHQGGTKRLADQRWRQPPWMSVHANLGGGEGGGGEGGGGEGGEGGGRLGGDGGGECVGGLGGLGDGGQSQSQRWEGGLQVRESTAGKSLRAVMRCEIWERQKQGGRGDSSTFNNLGGGSSGRGRGGDGGGGRGGGEGGGRGGGGLHGRGRAASPHAPDLQRGRPEWVVAYFCWHAFSLAGLKQGRQACRPGRLGRGRRGWRRGPACVGCWIAVQPRPSASCVGSRQRQRRQQGGRSYNSTVSNLGGGTGGEGGEGSGGRGGGCGGGGRGAWGVDGVADGPWMGGWAVDAGGERAASAALRDSGQGGPASFTRRDCTHLSEGSGDLMACSSFASWGLLRHRAVRRHAGGCAAPHSALEPCWTHPSRDAMPCIWCCHPTEIQCT